MPLSRKSLGIHYNKGSDLLDYLKDPGNFEYEKGYVKKLTGPGLGIEVNEEKVKMAKLGHRWKKSVWRRGWSGD